MDIINKTCPSCNGTGTTINWITTATAESSSFGFAQKKVDVCQRCLGKGYTEHALFSIEEARAILNHCGLSTESLP